MSDAGTIIAIVGLGNLLCFAQTYKHLAISKVTSAIGLLIIPSAVALLWRISISIGWWTVGIFVAASILVGVFNGVMARKHGVSFVYALQPTVGATFCICAVLSWLL